MNIQEDWSKRAEFRQLIRDELIPYLESCGYKKSFDNVELDSQNRDSWIFKIVFKGKQSIEISNVDWRDYTEYFNLYIDSKEALSINIDKEPSMEEALKNIKNQIDQYIS